MRTVPRNSAAEQAPARSHDLALRLPDATGLNLAFADSLRTLSPVLRTFVLATIAVPIVIYGFMPYLHRLRVRLLTQSGAS